MRHQGIVMAKTATGVHIRIVGADACADCKAHSVCNSSEKKDKFVDALLDASASARYNIGDTVTIEGAPSMGMKATVLGFGLPLLLMVAGIIVGAQLLNDETIGALAGLAVLLPYYLILWLLKPKLNEKFVFRVV